MSTLNRILLARQFAVASHGDQLYGKTFPYEYHLEKVQSVRQRFVTSDMISGYGLSEEDIIKAIWLHDVVEDTCIPLSILRVVFGDTVARLVDAVTDAKLPNANRKLRHWDTPSCPGPYSKIPVTNGSILVKLCDRIANVEAGIASIQKMKDPPKGGTLIDMYRKEHVEFYKTLHVQYSPSEPLWSHLNNLLDFDEKDIS